MTSAHGEQTELSGNRLVESDDHELIIKSLMKIHEPSVTVLALDPQRRPSRGATVVVPLCPMVFPAESRLKDKSKKVYVSRNFADIFAQVCEQSGWVDNAGNPRTENAEEPVAFVQVRGPPGSGKSLATFAALRYLTCVTGRGVLYVSFKSARVLRLPTVSVLKGNLVYSVNMTAGSVIDVINVMDDLLEKLQLHGVFFDGVYGSLFPLITRFGADLDDRRTNRPDRTKTTFVGLTTSMIPNVKVFEQAATFTSSPWLLKDYLKYAEALNGRFTSQQLHHLGCADGASLSEVKAAIKAKFLVVGHSARFMFDYTTETVVEELVEACNSVESELRGKSKSSVLAVDTLLVTMDNKCVPVSVAAAGIIAHKLQAPSYIASAEGTEMSIVIKAALKGHRPMLGWLFEEEVLEKLLDSIPNKISATDADATAGSSIPGIIASVEQTGAAARKDQAQAQTQAQPATVDSVAGALGNLGFGPLFTVRTEFALRCYAVANNKKGGTYNFPERCYIIHFRDDIDLVQQLHALVESGRTTHPVLCIPTVYVFPFLDMLLLRWTGPQRLQLEGDSFQITISDRHSCNATVIQCIAQCMAMCGLELTKVTHYAVLTSARQVRDFRFTGQDGMHCREPLPREAQTIAQGLLLKTQLVRAINKADIRVIIPSEKKRKLEATAGTAADESGLGAEDEEEGVRLVGGGVLQPETLEKREERENALKALKPPNRPVPARTGTTVELAPYHLVLENSRVAGVVESIERHATN